MVTYTVYVLRSLKNGRLYIGMTSDLARRMAEHNRGHNKSTKGRGPFELVHTERFPTRPQAREREKVLKSGRGREMIKRSLL